MDYPLGRFPRELLPFFAQEPVAYRNLSLTSRRVGQAVRPALPTICQAPISAAELARYIRGVPNTPLTSVSFYRIQDSNYYQYNIFNGDLIENMVNLPNTIPQEQLLPFLTSLGEPGPSGNLGTNWIDIGTIARLYKRRVSCITLDPNYAEKQMWGILQRRTLHLVAEIRQQQDPTLVERLIVILLNEITTAGRMTNLFSFLKLVEIQAEQNSILRNLPDQERLIQTALRMMAIIDTEVQRLQ